ncbi:hypothetical protein ACOJVU_16470 [Mycobacterium sp. THU-M104]
MATAGGPGVKKRSGLINEWRPEEFEALAGICPFFRFDPVEEFNNIE